MQGTALRSDSLMDVRLRINLAMAALATLDHSAPILPCAWRSTSANGMKIIHIHVNFSLKAIICISEVTSGQGAKKRMQQA